MARSNIIVADDEPDLSQLIAEYLGSHGFDVRTAADGGELDICLAQKAADLLILDVNMPGEDGISIARRIRAVSDTPIVMLTSANAMVDRLTALGLGVDDYVMKPFDLRELRARVCTILRRTAGLIAPLAIPAVAPEPQEDRIRFGQVVLDTKSHCLIREDGTSLALTPMEFQLLQAFAENPNRVLSRDRLLNLALRSNRDPFDRSIDIRVTRLRRKVETDPSKPVIIRTVRGTGYMFVPVNGTGLTP